MTVTETVHTDIGAAITLLGSAERCLRNGNTRAARGYIALAFTLVTSLKALTDVEVAL